MRRSGALLSLIMLDIDYFKKFNDTCGHLTGDDCLRKVAAILAEHIRQAVVKRVIPHSASDPAEYVTLSLRVVTVSAAVLAAPEQVVALADKAHYCAKKDGRNRDEVWEKITSTG